MHARSLFRGIIVLALAAYALVLGCVMLAGATGSHESDTSGDSSSVITASNSTTMRSQLPFRGAGMQLQRIDWMDKYKHSIDEIAAIGGDTVLLVMDARMENGNSSKVYLDMRMTPSPEQLGDLIGHAKKKNMRVVLMPIVLLDDPQGTEWRGTIKPQSWETWWQSYRDMMAGHFAWIAAVNHVDVLVIGSELVSTENKTDEWTKLIREVRHNFKGLITYSANWDHYRSVPFWNQLDLMATNSYYWLGEDEKVTVEEIKKNWKPKQKDLLEFAKSIGKPLLFTEVGWCSQTNAAKEPWDYTQDKPIDNDLQKRLYQAFFETWHGKSNFAGFMVWEWSPGDGGKGDDSQKIGYTPENKPAEQVIKEWLAKPRWEVK